MQMTNKSVKRCSTSLTVREAQIKTMVRYHLTSTKMTGIWKKWVLVELVVRKWNLCAEYTMVLAVIIVIENTWAVPKIVKQKYSMIFWVYTQSLRTWEIKTVLEVEIEIYKCRDIETNKPNLRNDMLLLLYNDQLWNNKGEGYTSLCWGSYRNLATTLQVSTLRIPLCSKLFLSPLTLNIPIQNRWNPATRLVS